MSEASKQLFWLDKNVPYIQSTGQEWLNTNYVLKAHDRVVVECLPAKVDDPSTSYRALFGARLGSYSSSCYSMFMKMHGSYQFCFARTGNEQTFTGLYGQRCLVECQDSKCTCTFEDGNQTSCTSSGSITDTANPCLIFTLNTSSSVGGVQPDVQDSGHTLPMNARIYSFSVYSQSNELVHQWVPYRLNQTTAGLRCKVDGSILLNQSGRGQLTYGVDR